MPDWYVLVFGIVAASAAGLFIGYKLYYATTSGVTFVTETVVQSVIFIREQTSNAWELAVNFALRYPTFAVTTGLGRVGFGPCVRFWDEVKNSTTIPWNQSSWWVPLDDLRCHDNATLAQCPALPYAYVSEAIYSRWWDAEVHAARAIITGVLLGYVWTNLLVWIATTSNGVLFHGTVVKRSGVASPSQLSNAPPLTQSVVMILYLQEEGTRLVKATLWGGTTLVVVIFTGLLDGAMYLLSFVSSRVQRVPVGAIASSLWATTCSAWSRTVDVVVPWLEQLGGRQMTFDDFSKAVTNQALLQSMQSTPPPTRDPDDIGSFMRWLKISEEGTMSRLVGAGLNDGKPLSLVKVFIEHPSLWRRWRHWLPSGHDLIIRNANKTSIFFSMSQNDCCFLRLRHLTEVGDAEKKDNLGDVFNKLSYKWIAPPTQARSKSQRTVTLTPAQAAAMGVVDGDVIVCSVPQAAAVASAAVPAAGAEADEVAHEPDVIAAPPTAQKGHASSSKTANGRAGSTGAAAARSSPNQVGGAAGPQ